MSTQYVANREGIAALGRGPEMSAAMLGIGKAAQSYAESIAPRSSGAYARSFNTLPTMVAVAGSWRAGAMVINSAPYAHGVEWRNGQHVLARTATYVDGRSRMVATTTDGASWRRSEAGGKALRASRRHRSRPSSKG